MRPDSCHTPSGRRRHVSISQPSPGSPVILNHTFDIVIDTNISTTLSPTKTNHTTRTPGNWYRNIVHCFGDHSVNLRRFPVKVNRESLDRSLVVWILLKLVNEYVGK
jgi:hypothetical protein